MNAVLMAIAVISLVVVRAAVKRWEYAYDSPPFAFIVFVIFTGFVAALLLLPAWNMGDFLAVLEKAWQTAYR